MNNRKLFVLLLLAVMLAAFGGVAGAQDEPVELSLWYHGAGNEVEREILVGIIEDFNASQSEYKVVLEEFPQLSYNESIVAAALSGDLPDIIDVDGPVMPNWAWSGYMHSRLTCQKAHWTASCQVRLACGTAKFTLSACGTLR